MEAGRLRVCSPVGDNGLVDIGQRNPGGANFQPVFTNGATWANIVVGVERPQRVRGDCVDRPRVPI